MTRELLPEHFHMRNQGMDKNRAIVKILMEFGIRVHALDTIAESLQEYNDCFHGSMVLQVENNNVAGCGNSGSAILTLAELLTAYGKLN
jgi:hypothetical protein